MRTQDYLDDLDYLFDRVKSIHPCIDFKTPLGVIEEEMELCKKRAKNCVDRQSFKQIVGSFLRTIGDAHTAIPVFQEDPQVVLPFSTELVQGQVIVNSLRKEIFDEEFSGFRRGSMIHYLSGRSIEEILEENLQRIPFNNVAWGRKKASRELASHVSLGVQGVEVTYSDSLGRVRTHDFPLFSASDASVRDCLMNEQRHTFAAPVEARILDEHRVGYLKIRSCWDRMIFNNVILSVFGIDPGSLPDIDRECWALFSAMVEEDIGELIIDLRGNQGGNSRLGHFIYKYLTKKDLLSYRTRVKISEELKGRNDSFRDHINGEILDYGEIRLMFPYETRLEEAQLKQLPSFEGTTVVLVDSDTYSSAEWIAAELSANELAIFAGEPTGGGGSVPGDQLYIELPRSELVLAVSCKFFEVPDGDIRRYGAVVPDFLFTPTIADYAEGKDTVLNQAIKLLRQGVS